MLNLKIVVSVKKTIVSTVSNMCMYHSPIQSYVYVYIYIHECLVYATKGKTT